MLEKASQLQAKSYPSYHVHGRRRMWHSGGSDYRSMNFHHAVFWNRLGDSFFVYLPVGVGFDMHRRTPVTAVVISGNQDIIVCTLVRIITSVD